MSNKTPIYNALVKAGNVTEAAKLLGIPRTSLYTGLAGEIVASGGGLKKIEQLDVVEEHQLKTRVKQLEKDNKDLTARVVREAAANKLIGNLDGVELEPPEWLVKPPSGKTHHATITAFLSDTHFDEVVVASEMNYVNAYNRDIATLRLKRFFDANIKVSRDYIGGVKIDGLVLPLGGDMVTGNIHEELERTNDAPILDTCVYWAEQICAGIEQQLDFFDRIFVPGVVGNHGRLRKKPQYKTVARDNYDWLIYKIIEKQFRGNDRVTFLIPDGPDCFYPVYGKVHLLTHGNQFSGGNGIGGIAVPIMRGDAKKAKTQSALGNPYDYMEIGHWHQRKALGNIRINGSLKGYDDFALAHSFDFELPQQSFWVNTPEHGITIDAPLFVYTKEEKKYW